MGTFSLPLPARPEHAVDKPSLADNYALPSPLRLAIVGCGAVTERLHLPALARLPGIRVTALVDPDAARLTAVAASLEPGLHAASSAAGLERHADAAIVAVPNHLHTSVATDLLERGLHVLVEKPLALSLREARTLIETAQRTGRTLGVGLIRRHYSSFAFVQHAVEAGWLGRIESFDFREGVAYAWSAASLSLFRRDHGGGALVDKGSHALDMLLAWLGPFARVRYRDDACGGAEANCLLELELRNGAAGIVELSWTRNLRNTCIIRGERGELEVGVFPDSAVTLRLGATALSGVPTDGRPPPFDILAADRAQLESFANSVRSDREPAAAVGGMLESIRLFDACRANREALDFKWVPFKGDVDWAKFAGKRVLILGGAGFIGNRVVEALAQNSGAHIRILVRSFSRIADAARYPVEIVRCDVGDRRTVRSAMQDCDYVINCTYGKGPREEQARVNIEAVKSMVQIAHECGVRQVVHTSTMMVYGAAKDGALDERTPSRASRRDVYGYTKWKGEEIALSEGRRLGVPVAVIQPAAVYGPNAPTWTLLPINRMKSGRIVLVDGGLGISNAVYVDDVVTALLNAAIEPRAQGESMLISGPDVVTWRDFYEAYDRLLGGGRTVAMTAAAIAEARRLQKKRQGNLVQLRALIREEQLRRRLLALPLLAGARSAVRAVLPRSVVEGLRTRLLAPGAPASANAAANDAVLLPGRAEESFFRAVVAVDCAKAAQLIGYTPRYSFKRGMTLVSGWARWAGVL